MEEQNPLNSSKKNLCSILNAGETCNGACQVHTFFSIRMAEYAKSVFNLENGPPLEVLLCYGNPYFNECAQRFARELDSAMDTYLTQSNPRVEVILKKPSIGQSTFDFSWALSHAHMPLSVADNGKEESSSNPFDYSLQLLKRYVNSGLATRAAVSPSRFFVTSSGEDIPLANMACQIVNVELSKSYPKKPALKVVHGLAIQYAGKYTMDIDYFIHQATNKS